MCWFESKMYPVNLTLRHIEASVLHPQWIEGAFAQERIECLARDPDVLNIPLSKNVFMIGEAINLKSTPSLNVEVNSSPTVIGHHAGTSKHRGISHEHVCVLVARDRTKATVPKVACIGRVVKTKVESIIGSKLTSDNVLVTDA